MLSNPERKRHYDKYGTVAEDEQGEAEFFEEFETMFFGGGMFGQGGDDMDDFMEFLETDTKYMRKMFRDLGKGARVSRKGRAKKDKYNADPDIDDMISFFMMPAMSMSMGMKMPTKSKK